MTTTSKAENGKRPPSTVTGEWEDAAVVRGGAEHACWVPALMVDGFKPEVIAEKLALQPAGSFTDPVITGTLIVEQAYGEPRYFVKWETKGERNGETIALPNHGAITNALDVVALDPAPRVRIEIKGKAPRGKPGENAPYLYDVRVLPKTAMLSAPRDGKDKSHGGHPALAPIHKANKARRDADAND